MKVDKISEERATSDYAAPPQTAVVCKRHQRVSPRRQLKQHSRRRWGADRVDEVRSSPLQGRVPFDKDCRRKHEKPIVSATDVTGPRATQVPQPQWTRKVRMTQVHQLKVEDQQPTKVESNFHLHECLDRNHVTYVGTYVGLRKNRTENQPDDACCESPKSTVYARTTRVPDPMLEEPTAEKLDAREMSSNFGATGGVGPPGSGRQFDGSKCTNLTRNGRTPGHGDPDTRIKPEPRQENGRRPHV